MLAMLPLMNMRAALAFKTDTQEESDSDDDDNSSTDESDDDNEPLPSTVVDISILNKKTQKNELFHVLLDTGTNRCMGTQAAVSRAGLKIKESQEHRFKTAAGYFITSHKAKIRSHRLLELNSRRVLQNLKIQVTKGDLGHYDFIFGRNYMKRYGIDLLFSQGVIQWDGMQMPMKTADKQPNPKEEETEDESDELHHIWIEDYNECHTAQHILDNTYAKTDLYKLTKKQIHLTPEEQDMLHSQGFNCI